MKNPENPSIDNYKQFWLFYLRQHHRPWTRRWHIAGTLLAIACVIAALVLASPWLLVAAPFAGYGPAWIAHFLVEKNQPAPWRYPLWSLASDFRMTLAWLSGSLDHEMHNAGIDSRQD